MRMTDALRGEHGVFYAMFDHLEQSIDQTASLEAIRSQAAQLAAALVPHARLENDVLFSRAEAELGSGGPIAVMRAEHDQIEGILSSVGAAADVVDARRRVRQTMALAREHFRKEEVVLFPLIEERVPASVLAQLGARWAEARGVALP